MSAIDSYAQDPAPVTPAAKARAKIEVRTIDWSDLAAALSAGWGDFRAAPLFDLFFGAVYALGGMGIVTLFFVLHMPWIGYPVVMGFALIAPFVAAGTYEVSRGLERGEPLTWRAVFGAVWARAGADLGWMALVTSFALIIWVDFAIFLFLAFYGLHVPTLGELLTNVATTSQGLLFAVTGNALGAVIAMFVFSITVVSFPLLVDRDVDFVTAMLTSVRCVRANPLRLAVWAAIIGALVAIACAPFFLGLFIILPVLGNASWHMYRRLIG